MSGTTSAALAWKRPTQPCGTRGSLPGSEINAGSCRPTPSSRKEGISSSASARSDSAPSPCFAAARRSASCELTGTMSWPDLSRRKMEQRATRRGRGGAVRDAPKNPFLLEGGADGLGHLEHAVGLLRALLDRLQGLAE